MKAYTVQFEFPCDNPEDNVVKRLRMKRGKQFIEFSVPINLPDLHHKGFSELLQLSQRRELLGLSTPLNNTDTSKK